MNRPVIAFWMTVCAIAAPAMADAPAQPVRANPAPASLFNPARHMKVSEVRIGMRGYGLTVFQGTKIDRFDVEVLSILRNFNPKYDVVLIKCFGPYLEHTGSIAGMSGSPVYLKDDAGRDRMIGAFAYGWPLTKDPVAGVQPIEYMLKLPTARRDQLAATQPIAVPANVRNSDGSGASIDWPASGAAMGWSLADAGMLPWPHPLPGARTLSGKSKAAAAAALALTGDGDAMPRLQPLTTPLMVSGVSPRLLQEMAPVFRADGFTPLQAGGSSSSAAEEPVPPLEPGSVLAVPLLTGDVDMTAIGTCTEVLGGRIFGFGHPFNNEGAIALPMGSGAINAVIANLQTSFKLGYMSKALGMLTTDQSVGVAGESGTAAPTVPMEFTVTYADGTPARTYHFESALHAKLTPMIASLAFGSALTGVSDLPQYNTLDYSLDLDFTDGHALHIADRAVNTNAGDVSGEIAIPMAAASDNPFRRVLVRRVTGSVRVSSDARAAQIMDVQVPRAKYRPGETVKGFVSYKPFRDKQAIMAVEMELPRDLPQGTYQLIISDADRYFQDELQSKPFRFTAENVQDVFDVMRYVTGIRHDALYLRLVRQPDGVALGRTALPLLPSSRRQILLGSGRSTTTAYISSTTKVIPTELVMNGSAEFAITIDRNPRGAMGSKIHTENQ